MSKKELIHCLNEKVGVERFYCVQECHKKYPIRNYDDRDAPLEACIQKCDNTAQKNAKECHNTYYTLFARVKYFLRKI